MAPAFRHFGSDVHAPHAAYMVVRVGRRADWVVMHPKLAAVDGGLLDFLAPHKAQRFINRDSLDVLELVREHVDAVRTAAQEYRVFLGIAAALLRGVFLACAAREVHGADFA